MDQDLLGQHVPYQSVYPQDLEFTREVSGLRCELTTNVNTPNIRVVRERMARQFYRFRKTPIEGRKAYPGMKLDL